MTTKNEFYTEVIWGQSPDPILLKMQQNIQLNSLAALTGVRQVGDQCEFEYNISSFISVETLLFTQRFNMRLCTRLLKNLEHLELQLDQYMLSKEMLIYRADALFFDSSADQFIWLLLPFKRDEKSLKKEQLNFFRHLLIEMEQCYIPGINTLLLETHFSISELKKYLLPELDELNTNLKLNKKDHKSISKVAENRFFSKIINRKRSRSASKNKRTFLKSKHTQNLPIPQDEYKTLSLKKTAYIQRHPILISRDQPALQYKIYYETCLIGRDDRCEISIDETSISREHAKLYTQETTYFIEDLNSTNGTFVNNQKIYNKTPIKHGDELRIGHCDFIFFI